MAEMDAPPEACGCPQVRERFCRVAPGEELEPRTLKRHWHISIALEERIMRKRHCEAFVTDLRTVGIASD